MIVSINQPAYLPWPGYFHRIAASDWHIELDHVQFEKNSLTNRNKVKSAAGALLLTVPVKTAGLFGQLPIRSVAIDNRQKWSRKHWETIRQCYSRAPFFSAYQAFWQETYRAPWEKLIELCTRTNRFFLEQFAISTPIQVSSEMKPTGAGSRLILDLCLKAGATVYLSGPLGRSYLKTDEFHAAGIEVKFHDYVYPEHPQMGATFEPNLSALDLLMNCGPSAKRYFAQEPSAHAGLAENNVLQRSPSS
jgi:hypothetical protein